VRTDRQLAVAITLLHGGAVLLLGLLWWFWG